MTVDEEGRLWHLRLGHISESNLNKMVNQGMTKGSGKYKLQQCDECILSRSTKLPYDTTEKHVNNLLEYVHLDLWGPARTEILGGGKYFLSIIDDCSRKLWFIIKDKTQVLQTFKDWHLEQENMIGKPL